MLIKRAFDSIKFRTKNAGTELWWTPEAVRLLENWPEVVADRVRVHLGLRPKCKVLRLRNGLTFALHPGSAGLYVVFLEIFSWEQYDKNPLFAIGSSDIDIDIGANIGFFTIKAARSARQGRVLAYEPCSLHFPLLAENVRHNQMANVLLANEAVWRANETLEFLYSNNSEPMDTSLFAMGGDRKETVKAVSLEEVFRRYAIERCDFPKMDCEGAEYDILYNTPDHVLKLIKRIVMEWHNLDSVQSPDNLAQFLIEKGFTLAGEHTWTGTTGYLYAYRQ